MTDVPITPDASPEPPAGPGQELSVDLAAFLPEGVELAAEEPPAAGEGDAVEVDIVEVEIVEVERDEVDGVEVETVTVVDAIAVVQADAAEPEPEVEVEVEPEAPAVDLEALSQIERDLDAVDVAIAALDAGTYGIDPTTGQPIDDALLAEDPTRLG